MENKKQDIGSMEVIEGLTVYPTLEEAEEWGAVEDIASLIEDDNEEAEADNSNG